MAVQSTGWTLVGTGENVNDGGDGSWDNLTAITDGSDATDSSCVVTTVSQQLRGTNCGFALPAGATILGVEVRIRRRLNTSNPEDHTVQLVVGGSLVGSNLADTVTTYPSTFTSADYGGSTNLWGTTLTASDVNATSFGVALKTNDDADVSSIWINVHYNDNPGDLFLRPTATSSAGSWVTSASGTDLHTAIDEVTASDADYIRSATDPATDVCKIQLGTGSVDTTKDVRVRYRYHASSNANITLVVRLVEGTTTRATWTHTNIPTTVVAASQTLSAGEVASITDWSNLFLEFQATKV